MKYSLSIGLICGRMYKLSFLVIAMVLPFFNANGRDFITHGIHFRQSIFFLENLQAVNSVSKIMKVSGNLSKNLFI